MGAGANSGQNKALNNRKERSLGRTKDRQREAIKEFQSMRPARSSTGGAFGKAKRYDSAP